MMRMSLLKAIWKRWTVIAHAIGGFQARVILAVLYIVLLAPFAVLVRLLSDPLQLRPPATTRWLSRPSKVTGLQEGRRQFS